jgi:asparagine synthase (glutamine-hydrolysing)
MISPLGRAARNVRGHCSAFGHALSDGDAGPGNRSLSAIAGMLHVDGRTVSDRALAAMAAAAPPRGFDGVTRWHDGPVGFIRAAHATTPEAVGEVQPQIGSGSGVAVLFDGRLDNRGDLLDLLGWHGAALRGAPDPAIVLALFERLGDAFVRQLVGDFAIALWQPRAQRLLLLRAPIGWRPLLWTFDGKTFGFATEPRSLVVGLGLERRLNEGVIGECLSLRFASQDETLWQGVQRLPPGAALAVERGQVRQWHWHDGPFEDLTRLSAADHVDRFRALFDKALIATTRGIGPVGAQLSGGLDSSSIVARATELHRAGRIERQVEAISARFPGEPHDETDYSSAVEAHLGITATTVGAQPFDLDAARAWCAATYQLPVRPNSLATLHNACGHLEATGGRVLLTGEGGDDWFSGTHAHWPDLLRQGQWRALMREGFNAWPDRSALVAARRIVYHSAMPLLSRRHRDRLFYPLLAAGDEPPPWIRADWAERIGLRERWQVTRPPIALPGFAQQHRYNQFMVSRYLFENMQAYAESRGVELRHPLHDQRLADFAMGASGTVMRGDGRKKYIMREAMQGTLPEKVRQRSDKTVFSVTIGDAVMGLLRERPLEDMLCVRHGWVDAGRLQQMADAYRAWRAAGAVGWSPASGVGPLWFAISVDIWLENAFGS